MKTQINKSEIFKAAWVLVKTAGKTISEALKAAWAKAKAPVVEVVEIVANFKAIQPATYKQLDYLNSFENFSHNFNSGSQFMKRVNSWEASEAIDLLKAGKTVRIVSVF